jgi:hypothetical protein
MMKKWVTHCLIIAISGVMSGCVSWLSVEKVTEETGSRNTGIRYYLPQPFIRVTPQADGSIEVQELFLPDPKEQYAIDVVSLLSNHTLDITLEGGFLKKIQLDAKSAEVAKALIESGGKLAEAKLTTNAEVEKAAANAKNAAEGERQKKIATAQATLANEERDLAVINAKLEVLRARPQSADRDRQILDLELERAEKQALVDAARSSLSTVSSGAFLAPGAKKEKEDPAYSPVLFRVVPDGDGVKLVVAPFRVSSGNGSGKTENQLPIDTYQKPTKQPEKKVTQISIGYAEDAVVVPKNGRLTLVLTASDSLVVSGIPARVIETKLLSLPNRDDVSSRVRSAIVRATGKDVIVEFAPDTPDGDYELSLSIEIGPPGDPDTIPFIDKQVIIHRPS